MRNTKRVLVTIIVGVFLLLLLGAVSAQELPDRFATMQQCKEAKPGKFAYYQPELTSKVKHTGERTYLLQDWCVLESTPSGPAYVRWSKGTYQYFRDGKPVADIRCKNRAEEGEEVPEEEAPAPTPTPTPIATPTPCPPSPTPTPTPVPEPTPCPTCPIKGIKIRTYATAGSRFWGGLRDLAISEAIAVPLGAVFSSPGRRLEGGALSAGTTLALNRTVHAFRPSDNEAEITIIYKDGRSVRLPSNLKKGKSLALLTEYPGAQIVWNKGDIYTTGLPEECGEYSAKPKSRTNITPFPFPLRSSKVVQPVVNKPPVIIITPHRTTTPNGSNSVANRVFGP